MKDTYGFPLMAEIVPETPGPEGNGYYIRHRIATEEDVRSCRSSAAIRGWWGYDGFEPGTYCTLNEKRGGMADQWMSDTWLERFTNRRILMEARGSVLILGLGIGMIPLACCRKEEVSSVTVVEIESQVIALVEPYIRHPKLRVIQGDAFAPPFRGKVFDTIYVDIWRDICADNWEPMKRLLREYRKLGRNGAYVDAWLKGYLQDLARQGRQQPYW